MIFNVNKVNREYNAIRKSKLFCAHPLTEFSGSGKTSIKLSFGRGSRRVAACGATGFGVAASFGDGYRGSLRFASFADTKERFNRFESGVDRYQPGVLM
jgi:hypothetical protein